MIEIKAIFKCDKCDYTEEKQLSISVSGSSEIARIPDTWTHFHGKDYCPKHKLERKVFIDGVECKE